jgi:hypothetical protein
MLLSTVEGQTAAEANAAYRRSLSPSKKKEKKEKTLAQKGKERKL